MHINSSIPNLIGGVSQQPELLRLPSHMKSQVNGMCSPSRGLSKRPGSRHMGMSQATGAGYYKVLDYGPRGVFHLHIQAGTIKVLNSAGTPVQLYNAAGAAIDSWGLSVPYPYLTATDPYSLKAVKEADTTFLVNREVLAAKSSIAAVSSSRAALVWIKAGNYGREYSVTVPGYDRAFYLTPAGSSAGDINYTQTSYIAQDLATQLFNQGLTCWADGSVIYFPVGVPGTKVEDNAGTTAISFIYRSVRSLGELPSGKVPNGFHMKIEGGDATGAGDYYVQFDTATNTWREVPDPMQASFRPNAATLPHKLVPYSTGFMIAPCEWPAQTVGDPETNPGPSFYGKAINDLFFYQDRMGMLSAEGFDLSETGTYFNFYRTTTLDLLDSDPISGTVTSASKVSTLRHAVPFGKRLFFFSDKGEFELQSDQVLTPKTGTTQQVAEFECSSTVRPEGIGSTLYFPVDRGTNTAFYNFFLDGIDNKAEAVDISAHVPYYIPKNVTHLAVSPVNNLMVALSPTAPGSLFVYQFYTNGGDRLQSAWHEWSFGDGAIIRSIGTVGTTLHLIVERWGDGGVDTCVETIDLNAPHVAHRMDRAIEVAPGSITVTPPTTYPAVSTFPVGYAERGGDYFAVVIGAGTKALKGAVYPVTMDGTTASVTANLTGCTVLFGRRYSLRAYLGRFVVREAAGQGSAGISRGRTQVGRLWVNYAESGAFAVEVHKEGLDPVVYRCSTRRLGSGSSIIGDATLQDGRFAVPVLSENTRVEVVLVNDSPLPSTFLSVDWEGYHVSRGQHV